MTGCPLLRPTHTHWKRERGRERGFGHYFIDVLDWITLEVAKDKQATDGKQAGSCQRSSASSMTAVSHVMDKKRGAFTEPRKQARVGYDCCSPVGYSEGQRPHIDTQISLRNKDI